MITWSFTWLPKKNNNNNSFLIIRKADISSHLVPSPTVQPKVFIEKQNKGSTGNVLAKSQPPYLNTRLKFIKGQHSISSGGTGVNCLCSPYPFPQVLLEGLQVSDSPKNLRQPVCPEETKLSFQKCHYFLQSSVFHF